MTTILIVDDDPDIGFVMKTALEVEGYQVLDANSGPKALEIAQREMVDLILLDIMMPGMDGYMVNQQLKEDPRTAEIPVIVITGRGAQNEFEEVQNMIIAENYLKKPFMLNQLLEVVKKIAT